jgi:hypothetical protein
MTAYVVDTNVLLAANGAHADLDPKCVESCVRRLADIQKSARVVIDDQYRILSEYLHKTNSATGKRPGDVFLKWLLQNQANGRRCDQVSLTETASEAFQEFPSKELECNFDSSDRKFVAVANAHPDKPPILQASDSKWLQWNAELKTLGLTVEFLCPEDICRFFTKKFPGSPIPEF